MKKSTKKEVRQALIRIQKLKELSTLLKGPENESPLEISFQAEQTQTEPAYKRRGVELRQVQHSSEKVAKGFDDRI